MNEAHILLIDDDRDLAELLGEYLDAEGFRLSAAHSGEEGIQELGRGDYDLVLLDVMMPGIDGFETLKQIRNTSAVPVLMLTAKGEETDRVLGLELGADDYLAKPYSHRELLARIKALLRRIELDRAQKENDTGSLECNGVTLNFDTYEVDCNGQTLPMTVSRGIGTRNHGLRSLHRYARIQRAPQDSDCNRRPQNPNHSRHRLPLC